MQHAPLVVVDAEITTPLAPRAAIALALIQSKVAWGVAVGVPGADAGLAKRELVGLEDRLACEARGAMAEATRCCHRSAQLALIRRQVRQATLQRSSMTSSEPHQSQLSVGMTRHVGASSVVVISATSACIFRFSIAPLSFSRMDRKW